MKRILSSEELSQISGGRSSFWDGFCAGVGIVTMAAPWLYLTGVGTVLLGVADAGCLIREIALL
jgi:hypothetical protein